MRINNFTRLKRFKRWKEMENSLKVFSFFEVRHDYTNTTINKYNINVTNTSYKPL